MHYGSDSLPDAMWLHTSSPEALSLEYAALPAPCICWVHNAARAAMLLSVACTTHHVTLAHRRSLHAAAKHIPEHAFMNEWACIEPSRGVQHGPQWQGLPLRLARSPREPSTQKAGRDEPAFAAASSAQKMACSSRACDLERPTLGHSPFPLVFWRISTASGPSRREGACGEPR